ncbi:MAG: hypothetical protein ACJ739_09615 [Acidimicrobiales bacterium]
MRLTGPRHLHAVRLEDDHVIVETPEHEIIDFEGCSSDEVEAKVHDFEAWAS